MRKVSKRILLRGFICFLLLSGILVVFSSLKSQFNSGQSEPSPQSFSKQKSWSDRVKYDTIAFNTSGSVKGNLTSQTLLP